MCVSCWELEGRRSCWGGNVTVSVWERPRKINNKSYINQSSHKIVLQRWPFLYRSSVYSLCKSIWFPLLQGQGGPRLFCSLNQWRRKISSSKQNLMFATLYFFVTFFRNYPYQKYILHRYGHVFTDDIYSRCCPKVYEHENYRLNSTKYLTTFKTGTVYKHSFYASSPSPKKFCT